MSQQEKPTPAFMRVKNMALHVDLGVSTIWKLAKERDDFPRPIKAGPRATLFETAAVEAFIRRQAQSLAKGAQSTQHPS
jgi:predicted DNA-binding transcriptional regulator AlpA